MRKTLDDAFVADTAEVIALAAGKDRGGNSVRLSGREEEDGVGRWFLEGLQQCVKSTGGEHVHLVDDVHFIFCFGRHEHDFVTDPADIIYAVVAGGVHLDDVQKRTVDDALTDLAFVTGIAVDRMQTVDRPRKDFRN